MENTGREGVREERRESGSVVGEVERQQMKRKGREEGSGEEGGELESEGCLCDQM